MSAAAAEWDRSSRVDVFRYTYCPSSNDYCVPINQTNFNSSAAYARTFYQDNGGGHFSRNPFYVNLYVTPSAYKRSIICHELGHVVGLNDRGNITSSCMATGSTFPNLPDGHDFDMLGAIYNHSN